MLKALRAQVNAALLTAGAARKPALRRSDAPDALLATDLPLIAHQEAVNRFVAEMALKGVRAWPDGRGWLLLDAPVPAPAEERSPLAAGECGCCISLLTRHPGKGEADGLIRAVVKAAEAGRQPFDRLCGDVHARLAAMLRMHNQLPGALLPYLCRAWNDLNDGRNHR